ncbi:uncharacterized protein TNCV_1109421 [Trichonephila clavipes]|nr:uncharacterized protein TNCV_1109421 [Trichonephila clavipes]
MSDRSPQNSSQPRPRSTPVIIRSFEHHAGNSTFWLGFTTILRENILVWSGTYLSLPLPPTVREDLRLDGDFRYPHAAKALYIYKHPCFLRNSNPGPTAQQSASLTAVPDRWFQFFVTHIDFINLNFLAVGSLVVGALDSRPEGMGSMPDATKYPPSTHGVRAR